MGRKKIPKSQRKVQVWIQVKAKYLKEAKIKAKEIEQYFTLLEYEETSRPRISDTEENKS
jgi:hypothetical protein